MVTTKFGPESAVFLHLITRIHPEIPVIWVDTGFNSASTLAFADQLRARLKLSVRRYTPALDQARSLVMPDEDDYAGFVHAIKLEPFARALRELKADVWFSSIRRYQTEHRSTQSVFETRCDGLLKVSPMLDWTAEEVQRYLDEHDLPRGPVCFDPTKLDTRSECGLHVRQVAMG